MSYLVDTNILLRLVQKNRRGDPTVEIFQAIADHNFTTISNISCSMN
ncbi:hypothetical protein [Nostoc sp.]